MKKKKKKVKLISVYLMHLKLTFSNVSFPKNQKKNKTKLTSVLFNYNRSSRNKHKSYCCMRSALIHLKQTKIHLNKNTI